MTLILMLLLPLAILIGAKLYWPDKVTTKEFLVCLGVVTVLICAGYAIGRASRTADTEIWSGRIRSKETYHQSCSHSYPCNCRTNSKGGTTCSTCYQHFYDVAWEATTTNDEQAYYNGHNAPYTSTPQRWREIRIGEPTAIEHSYTNYIKGNPDSVLRPRGYGVRYRNLIPSYPRVYDHYRANRFLSAGVPGLDLPHLDTRLSHLNAILAPDRKVSIIVLFTNNPNPDYAEGLREEWLGGKKNDLIVVVGAPEFPTLGWVRVVSWTRSEEIKVNIRERLMERGTYDEDMLFWILKDEVKHHFVRRRMHDFQYLAATIAPPTWAIVLLTVLGILTAIGLVYHAVHNDWFDDEYHSHYGFRTRRRRWG